MYKKLLAKPTQIEKLFLEVVLQASQSPLASPFPVTSQTSEEMTHLCITNTSLGFPGQCECVLDGLQGGAFGTRSGRGLAANET